MSIFRIGRSEKGNLDLMNVPGSNFTHVRDIKPQISSFHPRRMAEQWDNQNKKKKPLFPVFLNRRESNQEMWKGDC
jgi:hypothetical protein